MRPLSPFSEPTPRACQATRVSGHHKRTNSPQLLTPRCPDRADQPTQSGERAADEAPHARPLDSDDVTAGPSLYRRHRPRTFADVVGQEHVVRTLRNAVEQGKVHHAYLFVGSRGTGKTSMAKMLAACMNCEHGPTVEPCGQLRVVRRHRQRDVAGRHRDGRGVEQLGRRHPRAARVRAVRAGVRALEGLHPRRGAHAVLAGLERVPQDARGAAAAHDLRPRHDRGPEGPADGRRPLPPLRLRAARRSSRSPTVITRVAAAESIEIAPDAVALLARHATGSFRDALGTLEQLVTYTGTDIATDDVLAVLGVADADLLFEAFDAVAAGDARAAWLAAARLADTGRDIAQFLKDLEAHARDLLVVQTLGEVPPELRLTPDRDERLAEQAARIPGSSLVRLLDLLAEALRTVKDGADARTRLEAALVKAAAPEVDPAARALMARVERLEAALSGAAVAPAQPPRAAEPPRARTTAPTAASRAAARHPPLPHRPPRAGARPRAAEATGARPSPEPDRRRGERGHEPDRAPASGGARARPHPGEAAAPQPAAAPTATARDAGPTSTPSAACGPPSSTPSAPTTGCSPPASPRPTPSRSAATRSSSPSPSTTPSTARWPTAASTAPRSTTRCAAWPAARCAWSSSCASWDESSRGQAALRGRARGTLQDGVRRRGDRPRRPATRRARRVSLMPQPPNMQQMLKQVQKMQAGHGGRPGAAQARGGRGLGRRRHGHRQGLRRPRGQGDHHRPRGHRPRRPRAAAGHGPRRHQRGAARRPGAAAEPGSAGSPAAWTWARWACRASSACIRRPSNA